jgi:hypothetical protein
MADLPSRALLEAALAAADGAHDEYERVVLKGVSDNQWSGFYAAYVLGRLGEFATASRLATLVEEVEADANWTETAADYVLMKLRS